jgi:glucose dehydrogenase
MAELSMRHLTERSLVTVALLLAAGVVTFTRPQSGATALPAGAEWRSYAADSFSTKYSPLDQINAANVSKLRVAWRWSSNNFGPRNEGNMETTPVMIGGRLYFTAGQRRVIFAADAETGETLWMYRLEEGTRASLFPRPYDHGVTYWKDPTASDSDGAERIYAVTAGYNLVGLDAKTGLPVPSFGTKGIVDLYEGLERAQAGEIGATSPPIIVKDVIIVGAALKNGTSPASKMNVPADIRGYDVRTGKRLWTFHTIPRGALGWTAPAVFACGSAHLRLRAAGVRNVGAALPGGLDPAGCSRRDALAAALVGIEPSPLAWVVRGPPSAIHGTPVRAFDRVARKNLRVLAMIPLPLGSVFGNQWPNDLAPLAGTETG